MGRKTHNAFINHINAIREEMNFKRGIITIYEIKWLESYYWAKPLSEFKQIVRDFMKRKKEEN
jgi:hypothetical protein